MTPAELGSLMQRLAQRTGMETAPTVTAVERGAIRKFAAAVGESDRLYFDEEYARGTRFGGIIAPPSFVCTFTAGHFPEIVDATLPFRTMLHSDDLCRCYRVIRPGDIVTAFARYVGAHLGQGKLGPKVFQEADLLLQDEHGERFAEVRITTVSFGALGS